MLIPHKDHTDTIQVYSVTVMTHVKALQAGHSSQGTSEPITPARDTMCTQRVALHLYVRGLLKLYCCTSCRFDKQINHRIYFNGYNLHHIIWGTDSTQYLYLS